MSSELSRRSFLRGTATLAGVAAVGGLAAACSTSSSSSKAGQVNYWDSFVSQAPWVDNEIKLFEQAHRDIKIKKTTQVSDKYADLVSLAFRSNSAPDMFMLPKSPTFPEQVSDGWLMPLDKWATDSWKSRFPSDSFTEGINVVGGKTYSAPFNGAGPSLQLYIHNGVFKNAGLTNPDGSVKMPQTWDDISNAAATIKSRSGGKVYGLGFGNAQNVILEWWADILVRGAGSPGGMASAGVDSMDYRVGRWTYDTDRNYADAVALILEWKKNGYFYPSSMSISDEQARAFFEQGKFGMTIGGVWNQAEWTGHKFTDYSLMTLPSPDGAPKALYYGPPGGTFVAINAKTKNADQAFAWFDWIHSKEAADRWVAMGEGLSIYPDANNASKVKFKPFADYVSMSKFAIVGPQPNIKNPDAGKVTLANVKPDHNDVLAGLYTGQLKNVQDALSGLAGRRNKALADGIKAATAQGAKVSMADFTFPDWDISKPYETKPA
jgi:ABC-type glycerol-3-phosphate transport system substrate-binding protein